MALELVILLVWYFLEQGLDIQSSKNKTQKKVHFDPRILTSLQENSHKFTFDNIQTSLQMRKKIWKENFIKFAEFLECD